MKAAGETDPSTLVAKEGEAAADAGEAEAATMFVCQSMCGSESSADE